MEPFFQHPDPGEAPRGRIALLAYHFPPAETAGALRWQKLARHAYERGWALDAFTRAPEQLELRDDSRLRELPPGARVFGVPELPTRTRRAESFLWGRLRPWVRSWWSHSERSVDGSPSGPTSLAAGELRFRPWSPSSWRPAYEGWASYSEERAWGRAAAGYARSVIERERHRLVVSCGPPHGTHLGAELLHRSTGLPFVLDFRDLWSLTERWTAYRGSPVTVRLARRWEASGVRRATLVVLNTERACRAMREEYPERAERMISVMNGYDEEELPRVERDGCFRLSYAGTIYLDRTPRTLFAAVARLVREHRLEPGDLAVEFMGHIFPSPEAVLSLAREEDIESFVKVHPPGTRREANEFLARAPMLVNLPQDSHMAIPSKIFEYLRHDAWLLVLARRESASADALRGSPADVVDPNDVEGMYRALARRFEEHRRGATPGAIADETRLSRREQAERLFDAIDEALRRGAGQAS